MHYQNSLSILRQWKVVLSRPWILLPSCLHSYPVPACFYLSVYLNLIFKEALVFSFHDFHLPILAAGCKLAPRLLSLLVQGAFLSSPACSLPWDPQTEVCWPDFFPPPVNPVPGVSTPAFLLRNQELSMWVKRVSSWFYRVVLQCAWWTTSSLRNLALGANFYSWMA